MFQLSLLCYPAHHVVRWCQAMAAAHRESLRAEEERLYRDAEQQRVIDLAIAASSRTAEEERLRIQHEQVAQQEAYERALLLAVEQSRRDSAHKGKRRETDDERLEREQFELAVAQSLVDEELRVRERGRSAVMSSQELFGILSRPAEGEDDAESRDQVAHLEHRSTAQHALFDNADSAPASRQGSLTTALGQGEGSSTNVFLPAARQSSEPEVDVLPPPPA